jgi:hypothetical protein
MRKNHTRNEPVLICAVSEFRKGRRESPKVVSGKSCRRKIAKGHHLPSVNREKRNLNLVFPEFVLARRLPCLHRTNAREEGFHDRQYIADNFNDPDNNDYPIERWG